MNQVTIDFNHSKGTINRNIYGHFIEHIGGVIYNGLWVGEDSPIENIRGFRKALVDSLKSIHPPVLRWPGGCFAETYDWRDGVGLRAKRPVRVNWWYSHDKRTEPNQVGTHEFIDLCRMVDAQPYIAANLTSLTPLHIRDWVEYCNFPAGETTLADERAANGAREPFDVRLWGIGNENWGGGGQMTPEMCAREYIRYSTVINSLDKGRFRFIMCGANGHDLAWTRRLMQEWKARAWEEAPTYGMSVHYYTNQNYPGDPLNFTEDEWYLQIFKADYMRRIIDDHRSAMDEFDPERRLALIVDEWGNWHREGTGPSKGSNLFEQQSNMRDAVVAALTLNIFNNRCDTVAMANIAQLCNNLHSLYLAGDGNFVETPNYYVFDMYQGHQDAKQLETIVDAGYMERDGFGALEAVSASASIKDGTLTMTFANLDPATGKQIKLNALGNDLRGKAAITTLSSKDPHTCNTFEDLFAVRPVVHTEEWETNDPQVFLPAAGVVSVTLSLGAQP